jgi:hypothetical protein
MRKFGNVSDRMLRDKAQAEKVTTMITYKDPFEQDFADGATDNDAFQSSLFEMFDGLTEKIAEELQAYRKHAG